MALRIPHSEEAQVLFAVAVRSRLLCIAAWLEYSVVPPKFCGNGCEMEPKARVQYTANN